jgi:hypothetical protein
MKNGKSALEPFYIEEFSCDDVTVSSKDGKPFRINLEWDETGELLCAKHEGLGIDTFAFTREELEDDIHVNIKFLWKAYALGDEKSMNHEARQLRQNLLALLEAKPAHAKR